MKPKFLLLSLLLSTNVIAQEYQSISALSATKIDYDIGDLKYYSARSTYYFDKKTSIGPVDQFSYINTTSNVSGVFTHTDDNFLDKKDSNFSSVSGEIFTNSFLIGGSYSDVGAKDKNSYSMNVGYLFSSNLLLSSSVNKIEDEDRIYSFQARYNHQINHSDYFGISASTDDKGDNNYISATYFANLSGDKYVKIIADYVDYEGTKNDVRVKAEYFFDQYISTYLRYQRNDVRGIGAKYFFNDHIAVSTSFNINEKNNDAKVMNLSLHLQI